METYPLGNNPDTVRQIGNAGATIILLSLLDKLLALGRDVLTAHRFGVSASLDVFNITYSFPGTLVLLFSGALTSAFVPLYLEWRHRSSQETNSHVTWLLYSTTLLFAGLTLFCFLLTPEIVQLIGYGFQPEEKHAAVMMERFLILLTFIDGAGILLKGILHAEKRFFYLHVAPMLVNITTIAFLFLDTGRDIYALVWGVLIGTLIKTIYMAAALRLTNFKYGTPLPLDPGKMKTFWLLTTPLLGSQLIANSNLLVDHIMATQLDAGSVSTLRYAFRINDLPIQVVVVAISAAIFPFISEEVTAGRLNNLHHYFKYSLIVIGFLTLPITCLVVLFSEDVVTLLLKRGAFDQEAARQTAQILVCYSLSLFFYAYAFVNATFFAALQNTRVLLYMGIVSIFLNISFNFLFMDLFGVKGIALSTSATMGIISIWFIFLLKRKLGIADLSQIFSSFYRLIIALVGMLGAGMISLHLFELTGISRLVYAPLAAICASSCYLGIIWIFRTEDLDTCLTVLTHKMAIGKKALSSVKGKKGAMDE